MEHSVAWQRINAGLTGPAGTVGTDANTLVNLLIPVLQCGSSPIATGDNRISYVVNAGPINAPGAGSTGGTDLEFGFTTANNLSGSLERDAIMYTLFFDNLAESGRWSDVTPPAARCSTRVTVDNLTSMDGTSMTILLSENEDAGNWFWVRTVGSFHIPTASRWTGVGAGAWEFAERWVGFCYPSGVIGTQPHPTYPLQWLVGYETPRTPGQPVFINERRSNTTNPADPGFPEAARPSSGHPGIVVAAFADGSVRPLGENIDPNLFIQLARPGSGVILNPRDLE